MSSYSDDVTFTVTCTMHQRWAPHFVAMLRQMQYLGAIGSSREVTIYADGDGDFRPKFAIDPDIAPAKAAVTKTDGSTFFDAG